jgi:ATP-binding cassette, subfamily B, bacterial PglK
MSTLRALWGLLDARQRRRVLWLQAVGVLMACSTVVGIAALTPFLMVLADPTLIEKNTALAWLFDVLHFSARESFLVALGAGFVLVVLMGSVIGLLGTNALVRFALEVGDGLHAALLDEYLHRGLQFHSQVGAATLFNRVVYAINRVATGMLEGSMLLVSSATQVLFIVATICFVSPWLAALAALWIGGTYLLSYALARRRLHRNGLLETAHLEARARFATESLAGIQEVQVLGAQAHFRAGFERACRAISQVVAGNHAIAHLPRYVLEWVTVAGLVVAALVVSRGRDVSGWLAELAFLGFAAYRLLPAIQSLFTAVVRIRSNVPMFEEVRVDLQRALASGRVARADAGPWLDAPRMGLRLDDVSFRYDAGGAALASISADIPCGRIVGIVGPNGSGKSTLLAIVLGLLRPSSGRLCIDGVEIDAQRLRAWQRWLAYVPQNPTLLDATLAENIAFGVAADRIDAARLAAAVQMARLAPLVGELPHGLGQRIGASGLRLSGGQRQRVAIARALYRDSPVIVMDEATSSLDGLTEAEVLEVLRELRGQRTILCVAHRAAVIRACDHLLLLDAGALVGTGDFDSLVESSALFRRLTGAVPALRSTAAGHGGAQGIRQGRSAERAPQPSPGQAPAQG